MAIPFALIEQALSMVQAQAQATEENARAQAERQRIDGELARLENEARQAQEEARKAVDQVREDARQKIDKTNLETEHGLKGIHKDLQLCLARARNLAQENKRLKIQVQAFARRLQNFEHGAQAA